MTRIVVTGGSGKAGRWAIRHLLEQGYQVINIDLLAPEERLCPVTLADLSDFGQTLEVLSGIDDRYSGVDGVLHLAAIPAPGLYPNAHTFKVNTLSTYNIFEASRRLGIKNIVWASSETVLGLPFDRFPDQIPVDETSPPRPESSYSLSKLVGEVMAEQYCRWDPELKIVSLRLSNVMEPQDYGNFPDFQRDIRSRKWNLWGYIDARDAAQAMQKALEAPFKGAEVFVIANSDTVMERPNPELLTEVFPGVPVRAGLREHETLLAIDKAKKLLGYQPRYNWRDTPES